MDGREVADNGDMKLVLRVTGLDAVGVKLRHHFHGTMRSI